MATIRARMTADEHEARRISDLLEQAFEAEGYPVSVYEKVMDGPWTAEILFFDGTPEDAAPRIAERLGADAFSASIEADVLPETDWVVKSLEGLKPVRAGRFMVYGGHDADKLPANAIGIRIEAAQAFGTGHHGTTAGCLDELGRVLTRRNYSRVLDLGTGSGVLAIGIAKLAHVPVLATDIDPVATRIAAENARLNGVQSYLEVLTATGVTHRRFAECGPFDLVVANILARPLMGLAAPIAALMDREATLVLSGLRVSDGPRVIAAYRSQGFRLVRRGVREDWLTLTLANGRAEP